MKKLNTSALALMLTLMLSIALTSCGSDSSGGGEPETPLVIYANYMNAYVDGNTPPSREINIAPLYGGVPVEFKEHKIVEKTPGLVVKIGHTELYKFQIVVSNCNYNRRAEQHVTIEVTNKSNNKKSRVYVRFGDEFVPPANWPNLENFLVSHECLTAQDENTSNVPLQGTHYFHYKPQQEQ